MPHANADHLREFAGRILRAAGLAAGDAQATADCLILANLRGVDSHGVLRLMQHVKTLGAGNVNPRPDVHVLRRRGATAIVDADGGYGFRPSLLAVEVAIELAGGLGVGVVGVRNSHHFGMAAIYTLRAAEAGFIGLVTTTGGPILAPPGGVRTVVGNNPITCAVPRRPPQPPICLDMALSQVAFGKVRLAAAEGRPIPPGWAYDAQGRPTTDAAEALRAQMLAPVGDYKGYGLAVIAELLAGVLTDSPFAQDADGHGLREGGCGHFVLALDLTHFLDRSRFYDGVERLVAQIKAVPLAEGSPGVYLPGEPEWNTMQVRQREGIPISEELAEQLAALAGQLGVSGPRWQQP